MKKTRAVAYLRASTSKQELSVPEQRKQIRKFAKDRYKIVEWYIDDGKSGSKETEKRTAFAKLLKDSAKGDFDVVLCLDLSRFGRLDSLEGAAAKVTLRNNRIQLHTVLDGEIDWNTMQGRIVDAVLSEGQHDFSVRLGKKTLDGKLGAFLRGLPFGFKTPYGLAKRVIDTQGVAHHIERTQKFTRPKDWQSVLVPGDPHEQETVRWLFNEFASRDVGYRWLAAELNRKSVPSPTGKRWVGKVIDEILQNEKYIGNMRLGHRKAGKFWRIIDGQVVASLGAGFDRIPRGETLLLTETHEGIVDRSVFEVVQQKIQRRKKSASHSNKDGGYCLKDVLFCGQCSKPLYGNPNSGPKKSGKVIYVCKTAIRFGKQCECGQWNVKEEDVLPFIKKMLVAELDRETLRQAHAVPAKQVDVSVDDLKKKLAALDDKIERGSKNLLLASAENFSALDSQLSDLHAERSAVEVELKSHSEQPDWREIARFRNDWLRSMEGKLIDIQTHTSQNGKYSTGIVATKDSFRELLVSQGVRLDFWWERQSKQRWKVVRVRLRAFGLDTYLESISSLIVWWGARKGRRANNGCPAGSCPNTE